MPDTLKSPKQPFEQNVIEDTRPGWDEVWMQTALVIAKRSRCTRAQVGCVLVTADNRVVACSYNGPSPTYYPAEAMLDRLRSTGIAGKTTMCDQWCPRGAGLSQEDGHTDCPAVHAESNAISRADSSMLVGGTAFVTGAVCVSCAKLLAATRVARVVMRFEEKDAHRGLNRTTAFLENSGIEVTVVSV